MAETNAGCAQTLGALASRRRVGVGTIEEKWGGCVDEVLVFPAGSLCRRIEGRRVQRTNELTLNANAPVQTGRRDAGAPDELATSASVSR